jgi:hypothetical protein
VTLQAAHCRRLPWLHFEPRARIAIVWSSHRNLYAANCGAEEPVMSFLNFEEVLTHPSRLQLRFN